MASPSGDSHLKPDSVKSLMHTQKHPSTPPPHTHTHTRTHPHTQTQLSVCITSRCLLKCMHKRIEQAHTQLSVTDSLIR